MRDATSDGRARGFVLVPLVPPECAVVAARDVGLPAPRPMPADRPDRPVPILRQHPCRQPERGGDAIRRDAASLRKGRELGPPGPRSPISATDEATD